MSRSFLDASIPDLVGKLSTDEKIKLLSGPNWWNTNAIERLGIPAVRMSDGPNGVRGSSHFVSTPAQCLPCATSLASTFDPDLLFEVGKFLGEEAKIKSSVILLAPTCNIQRNPLGGRAFESFSEDPHLSGSLAAAYVNGLQSQGVASTIKHFVGNDQEHERTAAESVMSDRALREIYLYPFMLAQKKARPWAFMTSYGRINGVHCAENPTLLKDILRKEWGFDGIVMSDWFGTYSVDLSINAGLDLEMPGPPRWRTQLLVNHTLSCQKVLPSTLDERAQDILSFVQRQAQRNPDVVFGDGEERTRDSPEGRKFCRRLAAEGIVVLKNEQDVLPIEAKKVKRVALIGPNMKDRIISGGGSAALKASYIVTPYAGIVDNAPKGIEFDYAVGCYAYKYTPTLEAYLKTPSGQPGWSCTFYNHDANGNPTGDAVAEFVLQDTRVKLNDFLPKGLTETWTIKLHGSLTMDKTADYELGLTVAGRAKLFVNDKLTIDNWTKQRPGDFFYGQGTVEELGTVSLTAGKPVDIVVEYTNTKAPEDTESDRSQPALMRGVRLGGCEKIDPEEAMAAAEKLAASSDVAVVVAGLSPDWESEGFDRPTLEMPGTQNELIARIAKANPNTIVCIQSGSVVAMPWVHDVHGIVQAWYAGNETGNALADVLFGALNPSGRLPITLPVRVQDIPAFPNFRSEHGQIHYREDLLVGYKGYAARGIKPLFPFGFGLSYTTFAFSDLKVASSVQSGAADHFAVQVELTVTNTGSRAGSEVVQLYVSLPDIGLTTPRLQLRAFAKARDLAPGESKRVVLGLDKYAVSYWDTTGQQWKAPKGTYGVHVGKSSEDIVLESEFQVEKEFTWVGL
ncbi:glycoside hydrolase family 3 protein [Trametes versicolor FP-101664 SS1]|uniref:glycoside hydrolase family 3 protein n=1 Tax=Trametes versicolor (strain FP-101664) TaxID=717944 RepID=UPI00046243B8|nr:glycoside hydrolase family 3 protein [Trametes versicolor FP-101664 SS1]EIW60730.1 glycoside hydrolase family 3 protein [Trametes versicolor FP-101664 SS1]